MFNEASLFTFSKGTHGFDVTVPKNYLNDKYLPKKRTMELVFFEMNKCVRNICRTMHWVPLTTSPKMERERLVVTFSICREVLLPFTVKVSTLYQR